MEARSDRLKRPSGGQALPAADGVRGGVGLAVRYGAATAHEMNDAYMTRFAAAFARLKAARYDQLRDAQIAAWGLAKPSSADFQGTTTELRTRHSPSPPRQRRAISIDPEPSASLDLSDRPLLCSSHHPRTNMLAVGSSDHAAYAIDVATQHLKRTLYTKTDGHREWVTSVTHTADGDVVSGGMDSKLCLWRRDSTMCQELVGHKASISGVSSHDNVVISSSYDKSVRVWSRQTLHCYASLREHRAPIMHLAMRGGDVCATGDRGGSVLVWNLSTASLTWRLKKIHKGHVTAVRWLHPSAAEGAIGSSRFFTGGQDGRLRLWDLRDHSNVLTTTVHGIGAAAAVNDVLLLSTNEDLVITCGADRTLKVMDCRDACSKAVWEVELQDFPYAATVHGDVVLCSTGDGSLSILDVQSCEVRQTIRTHPSALRFLHVTEDQVIGGGDSGAVYFHPLQ